MTKSEVKKFLCGDHRPDGKVQAIDIETLQFRKAEEDEICRCSRQTGYDPQSGALYCGAIGEYISNVFEGRVVVLCETHKPPKHLIS